MQSAQSTYVYVGHGKKFEFNEIKKPFNIKKDISITIPTYNEEGNLENIVSAIQKALKPTGQSLEIIIIDDNSKDKTPEIMDALAQKHKGEVVALHRYGKRGIFSAHLDGIKVSNGKYLVIMDSDFAHPPELLPKFLEYKDKYDLVIGSRFIKGGDMKDSFIAKYGSKTLNMMCSFILGLNISDIGGGFHLIRKDKFEKIKFKYPDSKFGEFDFELLYRAVKLGFTIKEIPFILKKRNEGKSKMGNKLKMSYYYFRRAFQLRFGKFL